MHPYKMLVMPFIPGIYNYCDHWCERCLFTSSCRAYHVTAVPDAEIDEDKDVFGKYIMRTFEKASGLLGKAAEQCGIRNPPLHSKRSIRKLPPVDYGHEVLVLSKSYLAAAKSFLDKSHIFQDKADAILRHYELGLTSDQSAIAISRQLKECVEVVQWYLYFIHVKFIRALSSKADEYGLEEDDFQKDSDGSASIALIAVQRSIGAWYGLYEQLSGNEDEILSILSLLSKIKSEGEREFPGAASFKRPGFDD
jgi:hypothetical protein